MTKALLGLTYSRNFIKFSQIFLVKMLWIGCNFTILTFFRPKSFCFCVISKRNNYILKFCMIFGRPTEHSSVVAAVLLYYSYFKEVYTSCYYFIHVYYWSIIIFIIIGDSLVRATSLTYYSFSVVFSSQSYTLRDYYCTITYVAVILDEVFDLGGTYYWGCFC